MAKRSPRGPLGTAAPPGLVPWFIALTLALQWGAGAGGPLAAHCLCSA